MSIRKGLVISALGLALVGGLVGCGEEKEQPTKTMNPTHQTPDETKHPVKPIKEPKPTVTPMEKLPPKDK